MSAPRAEIFDEPKGDLPDHYASIGRLVTGFSNIERALNEVIRAVIGQHAGAGLTEQMSRALVGEMRAGELMATLKRVLEARERDAAKGGAAKPPKPDAMEPLFREIGELKLVRDRIAHHRFFVLDRRMLFTNADTARSQPAAQANMYCVEELNEMAGYARRLTDRVYLLRAALFLDSATAAMTRDPALLEIPARLRIADSSDGQGKVRPKRQRRPRSSRG
jgi:hypothetical protein